MVVLTTTIILHLKAFVLWPFATSKNLFFEVAKRRSTILFKHVGVGLNRY